MIKTTIKNLVGKDDFNSPSFLNNDVIHFISRDGLTIYHLLAQDMIGKNSLKDEYTLLSHDEYVSKLKNEETK